MACIFGSVCEQYQWLMLAGLVAYLAYNHFVWKKALSYWKSRNISGPKPIPIFGNFLSVFFRPRPVVELDWYQKYGKIYGTYSGNKPGLCIGEPELIKQIMVKDFHSFRNRRDNPSKHPIFSKNLFGSRDDDWKRIRAIASPTFTSGKMKKMYQLINTCCTDFLNNLSEITDTKKDIEVKTLMGDYTMDVIARCAFATNPNTYKDPDSVFRNKANAIFTISLPKILTLTALPTFITKHQWVRDLINPSTNSSFFVDISRDLIKQRKVDNIKRNDFLQLLIDVERSDGEIREESESNEAHHVNEGDDELKANAEALGNVVEKKLTENEILAQCFIFFIAGFETTGTTLSYCMYELALQPDVQQRLREETGDAFNEKGDIDYDVLSKLPYLDSVLSETLRHYPPLPRIDRMAMEDVMLGDTGIKIEKEVVAEIPVYAVHHDPDNYPNPFTFNPDRFMPENRHNIKPYTYLPFGAGPRNCIGMRFALLEAKLVLAKTLQKFKFTRVPETDVPVIFSKGRFLLQAQRIIIGIEKI